MYYLGICKLNMEGKPMAKSQSNSSMNTYKTCPKKYAYHYSDQKRSVAQTPAMALGNLVHEAFAHSLLGDATTQEALDYLDTAFMYDERDKAKDIVEYYAPLIGFGSSIQAYTMLGKRVIEKRFDVQVAGRFQAMGYIDAIITDRHGNLVLVDWKTRATLLDSRQLALDNQLYLYAYVAREVLGIPITKACQVQIKTSPPAKPELLRTYESWVKNATDLTDPPKRVVSKALGNTTAQVFIDGCIELGVADLVDIEDYKHKFVDESQFLRMSYIDMSKVDQKIDEFIQWCHKIETDTVFLPVNNANTCKWCQYNDLCIDN